MRSCNQLANHNLAGGSNSVGCFPTRLNACISLADKVENDNTNDIHRNRGISLILEMKDDDE